jgi:hypothetical protein
MVIHMGGYNDPHTEQSIHAHAADAIIREVRLKMGKSVAKPILLKAGCWSIHPHSRGNFVYSFDSYIPFDQIIPYEHILLNPFLGSGQLWPSLGWTHLLVHGVPTMDLDGTVFRPDVLQKEVKAMPGLKLANLTMAPRWLKPANSISTFYSLVTFAISDPDSSLTGNLFRA